MRGVVPTMGVSWSSRRCVHVCASCKPSRDESETCDEENIAIDEDAPHCFRGEADTDNDTVAALSSSSVSASRLDISPFLADLLPDDVLGVSTSPSHDRLRHTSTLDCSTVAEDQTYRDAPLPSCSSSPTSHDTLFQSSRSARHLFPNMDSAALYVTRKGPHFLASQHDYSSWSSSSSSSSPPSSTHAATRNRAAAAGDTYDNASAAVQRLPRLLTQAAGHFLDVTASSAHTHTLATSPVFVRTMLEQSLLSLYGGKELTPSASAASHKPHLAAMYRWNYGTLPATLQQSVNACTATIASASAFSFYLAFARLSRRRSTQVMALELFVLWFYCNPDQFPLELNDTHSHHHPCRESSAEACTGHASRTDSRHATNVCADDDKHAESLVSVPGPAPNVLHHRAANEYDELYLNGRRRRSDRSCTRLEAQLTNFVRHASAAQQAASRRAGGFLTVRRVIPEYYRRRVRDELRAEPAAEHKYRISCALLPHVVHLALSLSAPPPPPVREASGVVGRQQRTHEEKEDTSKETKAHAEGLEDVRTRIAASARCTRGEELIADLLHNWIVPLFATQAEVKARDECAHGRTVANASTRATHSALDVRVWLPPPTAWATLCPPHRETGHCVDARRLTPSTAATPTRRLGGELRVDEEWAGFVVLVGAVAVVQRRLPALRWALVRHGRRARRTRAGGRVRHDAQYHRRVRDYAQVVDAMQRDFATWAATLCERQTLQAVWEVCGGVGESRRRHTHAQHRAHGNDCNTDSHVSRRSCEANAVVYAPRGSCVGGAPLIPCALDGNTPTQPPLHTTPRTVCYDSFCSALRKPDSCSSGDTRRVSLPSCGIGCTTDSSHRCPLCCIAVRPCRHCGPCGHWRASAVGQRAVLTWSDEPWHTPYVIGSDLMCRRCRRRCCCCRCLRVRRMHRGLC